MSINTDNLLSTTPPSGSLGFYKPGDEPSAARVNSVADSLLFKTPQSRSLELYDPDTASEESITDTTDSQSHTRSNYEDEVKAYFYTANLAENIQETATRGTWIGLAALGLAAATSGAGLLLLPAAVYYKYKSNSMQSDYNAIRDIYVNANEALDGCMTVEQAVEIYAYIKMKPTERMRKRSMGIAVTPLIDPRTGNPTEKYGIHIWDRRSSGYLGRGGQGIVKKALIYDASTGRFQTKALKKDIASYPDQNLEAVEALKRSLVKQPIAHTEDHATLMAPLGNGRWCAVYDIAVGDAKSRHFADAKDLQQFNYKIAVATNNLHAQNVVHRDLKRGNILVDQHGDPIVGDFGLAVGADEVIKTAWGTPLFTPKQELDKHGTEHSPSKHQDVHAYGITLLELMYQFLEQQDLGNLSSEERAALKRHGLKTMRHLPAQHYHGAIANNMMPREQIEHILQKIGLSDEDQEILLHMDALYRDIIGTPEDKVSLSMDMVVKRFESQNK